MLFNNLFVNPIDEYPRASNRICALVEIDTNTVYQMPNSGPIFKHTFEQYNLTSNYYH